MTAIERMKELNQKKFPTNAEMAEAYYELDKLLAVVEAVEKADLDNLPESERRPISDALAALREDAK